MLYHAFKLYKLAPELRWTAGPYIWPVDRVVDMAAELLERSPGRRHPFSAHGDAPADEEFAAIAHRVVASGGVPLAQAEVTVLSDKLAGGPVSKERVPFVTGGALDRLVVNILLVAYVP
jgi:hypothetical protein